MRECEIRRLMPGEPVDADRINELLRQIDPARKPASAQDVAETVDNANNLVTVALDNGVIVGMFICLVQPCMGRWIASLHDFVVDEKYRNDGIGEKLIREQMRLFRAVCNEHSRSIQPYATANPKRAASNALMRKVGMTQVARAEGPHGTNLYKIVVHPDG